MSNRAEAVPAIYSVWDKLFSMEEALFSTEKSSKAHKRSNHFVRIWIIEQFIDSSYEFISEIVPKNFSLMLIVFELFSSLKA